MSKLVDDVKTGLKGIRGVGDQVRGNLMEATDQTFERDPAHPESVAKQAQNRVIAEKGKQDLDQADDMLARREMEHRTGGAGVSNRVTAAAEPVSTGQPHLGQHRETVPPVSQHTHVQQQGICHEQHVHQQRREVPAPGTLAREARKGPLLGTTTHENFQH